jgi:ribonuclease HII
LALEIETIYAQVLLDGGLKAPVEFKNQKTIIKGDEKEMVIALASICAKVLRDRKMNLLAKKYSNYGFEKHKGYGTKGHYEAIKKYGMLSVHRKSFLKI